MKRTLILDVQSYWHAGTGLGSGSDLDALVARTAGGLPYLPGRTVRGLLRDVMELAAQLGEFSPELVERCFGSGLTEAVDSDNRVAVLEEGRFSTRPGQLRVEDARLGDLPPNAPAWEAWAHAHPRSVDVFVTSIASTAMKDGLVVPHTLRRIEVAVPVILSAQLEGPADDWADAVERSLPYLRCLGSHRNRGLGRVHAYLLAGATA